MDEEVFLTAVPAAAEPHDGARSVYDPAKKAARSPFSRNPIRRREAVLIGINNYFDSSVASLRYCVNDICVMQQVLERLGYIVHALHDDAVEAHRKPTRANVSGLLDAVCARLDKDDMLLVQLSCHGMLVDEQCVLIMQDTWRNRIAQDGLPVAQVRDAMKASKARQRVLILDACHSGIEPGKSMATESTAAEAAFNRRVLELTRGFALLSSSTAAQVSMEWREQKHGLFTYFMLQGLKGKASRADNVVTVDDLRHYVRREMVRWSEHHLNHPVQEPTAQTEGSGDIILADLTGAVFPSIPPPSLTEAADQPTSPVYARAAEITVACGCDRDEQWTPWEKLAPSRGSWLFLLPGPKGEAHDLFLRRLEEDQRRAFPGAPPPLVHRVSWPRRQRPPAVEADYRQALALALKSPRDDEDALLERLKKQREGYQLVLIHPVLSRGHCDEGLLEYYGSFLPSLLDKSRGPKSLGVKVVQPVEWVPASWWLQFLASVVSALWVRPPEACLRALGQRKFQQLRKKLAQRWSGSLNIEVLPALRRITDQQVRQFLRSLDLPTEEQQQIIEELAPLDRESGYLLYNLIGQLSTYKDPDAFLRNPIKLPTETSSG